MNYDFPIIKNISDVLPAIEDSPEFFVAERDGYKVINYQVSMTDTFPPVNSTTISGIPVTNFNAKIRRECRGIIFDSFTGDIVRRPYHKFFNVNEREETQSHLIDLSNPHVILEKLDGSMIVPFIDTNSKLVWGTKMVAQDFHQMIEHFVKSSDIDYEGFCLNLINSGYSPIFEWTHPQKRIVIDYGKEPTLILTAVRHMITGNYLSINPT